jgi:hypothetical protein
MYKEQNGRLITLKINNKKLKRLKYISIIKHLQLFHTEWLIYIIKQNFILLGVNNKWSKYINPFKYLTYL